jgi:Domain of unknown function (DUF4954)
LSLLLAESNLDSRKARKEDLGMMASSSLDASSSTATCTPHDFDACRRYRADLLAWTGRVWDLAAAFQESDGTSCSFFRRVDDACSIRALSKEESNRVHQGRNRVAPWARMFVVVPTEQLKLDQSSALAQVLAAGSNSNNNRWHGTVIWVIASDVNVSSPASSTTDVGSIRDSTIGNSILHLPAHIEQSKIDHAHVGPHAHIESSRIGGGRDDSSSSSNDAGPLRLPPAEHLLIHVGAESGGGRELILDAACTLRDVSNQLVVKASSKRSTDESSGSSVTVTNFVGQHCRVVGTSRADRILLYPHSSLISATHVSNATLYPHASIQNGCVVRNCLMQWHCQISDLSSVTNAVLMEQAHVGPHSTVSESVLGPDVHVSNGEIHASLLGPNTNAHHQSLLISTLWLCGRGNVGYGANVGSNHTGRSPDQEAVAGEGVFFGLSCVVKFPVSLAPYTLVSAGTQLSPQRMTLPFSLIANDALLPGWVLTSSPYTLARAEIKVATRRKAVRHDASWPVLRPATVRQCVEARTSLSRVQPCGGDRTSYNEKDVPGIGACVLTEKARMSGIRAYTDCIQRYALRGLLDWLVDKWRDGEPTMLEKRVRDLMVDLSTSAAPPSVARDADDDCGVPWEVFPWEEDKTQAWDYVKQLVQKEFPPELNGGNDGMSRLSLLLQRLIELETNYAQQVRDCKRRDDVRGHRTIPGYAASHVMAIDDPVVVHVQKESNKTVDQARHVLGRLTPPSIRVESKL